MPGVWWRATRAGSAAVWRIVAVSVEDARAILAAWEADADEWWIVRESEKQTEAATRLRNVGNK